MHGVTTKIKNKRAFVVEVSLLLQANSVGPRTKKKEHEFTKYAASDRKLRGAVFTERHRVTARHV